MDQGRRGIPSGNNFPGDGSEDSEQPDEIAKLGGKDPTQPLLDKGAAGADPKNKED